jgi:hypothetical protein
MNGYFVQSSSAGVNIANLNSGYWKTRIVAAGRLKESYYKKAGIAIPTGEIQESKEIDVEENSDFEPVPFPEDMANIISEYATLLNVPKDKIQVPEVFAFIENNRYAPFNITNRCSNKLQKNICLANTLLKDVFDVDLKAENNEAFLAKNTGKLADKDKLSLLDIVQLKGVKKNSNATITGIFLYNDYFLHMIDGDLAVSSLADSAFKKYTMSYHRFNEDILKRALSNIIEKRKGMVNPDQKNEKPEKEKPVKKQPANLLKKDSTGRG